MLNFRKCAAVVWNSHRAVTLADNKDFGRLVTGCLRFGGLHFLKELLEDPHEWLVVFGAKDFGDKSSSFVEKLTSELQSHQGQMC